MIPSFVCALPNGAELGTYYALDLGGTNFRVLKVRAAGRPARWRAGWLADPPPARLTG